MPGELNAEQIHTSRSCQFAIGNRSETVGTDSPSATFVFTRMRFAGRTRSSADIPRRSGAFIIL